ncbi:hypothetical protein METBISCDRAFT_180, partial [Metschnikowia bicuspidata]
MVLSTCASLQWVPGDASELMHTLVFMSPADHFVDARIYKNQYPHIQEDFEDIFDWVIVGEKVPLSDSRIRFTHAVDLREIMTALKTNRPLLECRSGPDIGEFSPVEGSANRRETGTMVHPATGVPTEYVEIWRLLDPIRTTFETEVAEGDAWDATVCTATYRYSEGKRQGRVIVLGNWVQGVIYDSL